MPFSAKKTTLAPLAVLAALGVAGVADAQSVRTTSIASPADANGSSDNTTFSQDNRLVRLMAFDSGASNLVPGDGNGRRDVILFSRGGASGTSRRASPASASAPAGVRATATAPSPRSTATRSARRTA